jgi:hypothetical protein
MSVIKAPLASLPLASLLPSCFPSPYLAALSLFFRSTLCSACKSYPPFHEAAPLILSAHCPRSLSSCYFDCLFCHHFIDFLVDLSTPRLLPSLLPSVWPHVLLSSTVCLSLLPLLSSTLCLFLPSCFSFSTCLVLLLASQLCFPPAIVLPFITHPLLLPTFFRLPPLCLFSASARPLVYCVCSPTRYLPVSCLHFTFHLPLFS